MTGFLGKSRRGLLAGAASIIALTAAAAAAQAQAIGQTGGQTAARAFAIAPQPLASALTAFGIAADMEVTYPAGLIGGVRSPGATGSQAPLAALSQLLAGTGFTYRMTGPTSVTLIPVPKAEGAEVLPPVNVEGENAWGPVKGYVASRSATATKTDTPLLETPQSISVVGAEEMEARNVRTLEDAIKYTPGVQLSYGATGDNRGSWYAMRGFATTTTYYRDGLKVGGQNWQRLDPYLAERVEIMRGPSSVMYGQNMPGGIINSVSKRPQAAPMTELAVEYGSFDWKRVEADATGRLDKKGEWLYRLTGAWLDGDGLNNIDHDRSNRIMIAPSLTWAPQSGSSVTLSYLHQKDDNAGWWPRMIYKTSAGVTSPTAYHGEPGYDDYNQTQNHLTLQAEHAFSDRLKVSLAARYSNYALDYRQTWRGTVQANGSVLNRNNYAYRQEADIIALDARIQGEADFGGARHTVLAGFDYFYENRDNWFGSAADFPVSLFNPTYGTHRVVNASTYSKGDIRSPGVYAQDQIEIGENWVALLGGRADLSGSYGGVNYQDTFTGRLGLVYKTSFGLVPYASYAESFEPQSGADWSGKAFQPTAGRQYEVGLKYEPPGVNAVATLALFDLRKQNVLTPDPDLTHVCNGSRCSVQTGEVESRGVELGLTMGLAEGLNLVAAYTFNPVNVSKSNTPGEIGRQQAGAPVHIASLWLDYAVQDGPLKGVGFGGGLRFLGPTSAYNATLGNARTKAQVIDELMARYEADNWRASVNVKNLFDRQVEYSCSRVANATSCYLNEPLTVTARLAKKF